MNNEELVRQYAAAWNRKDADAMYHLFHKDGFYYDAFWNETCAKQQFKSFWRSYFRDLERWQQFSIKSRALKTIFIGKDQAVVHYSISQENEAGVFTEIFQGAEFYIFKDNLILSVRDHYCDPNPSVLRELSTYNAQSLHKPKYAKSGLRAAKIAKVKSQLLQMMNSDHLFSDPNLSLLNLARRLRCSPNDLSQIINSELGKNYYDFINGYRIEHAKQLLLTEPALDSDFYKHVARRSGFSSMSAFYRVFKNVCDESPARFRKKQL